MRPDVRQHPRAMLGCDRVAPSASRGINGFPPRAAQLYLRKDVEDFRMQVRLAPNLGLVQAEADAAVMARQ